MSVESNSLSCSQNKPSWKSPLSRICKLFAITPTSRLCMSTSTRQRGIKYFHRVIATSSKNRCVFWTTTWFYAHDSSTLCQVIAFLSFLKNFGRKSVNDVQCKVTTTGIQHAVASCTQNILWFSWSRIIWKVVKHCSKWLDAFHCWTCRNHWTSGMFPYVCWRKSVVFNTRLY